jgi:hypothetical protein
MGPANLLPAAPNPTPGGPVSKNTSDKPGKAIPHSAKGADAAPQPHPSPLDALDDTPIAPPHARDLVAALRAYARRITLEPKTHTTISQYPNSLRLRAPLGN